MSIRLIAAAMLAAGGLAVAACGGEESSGAAEDGGGEKTAEQRARDASVKYAECMREQGVDVPDPQVSEDGRIMNRIPEGVDRDELRAAQGKCRKHMEGAGGRKPSEEEQEQMREQVLAYAECMRKEGVDFPDPQFQEGGGVIFGGGGKGKGGLDPDDPDFRRASEACRDKQPKRPGANP